MKTRTAGTLALSLVWLLSAAAGEDSPVTATRKPVLLELFTSEGCSSCPLADALLQALDKKQPVAGADLIVLSEHVDYWNHDGWADPYSAAAFSSRQGGLRAEIRSGKRVYAPVDRGRNGGELVGSNGAGAVSSHRQGAAAEQTPGRAE